MGVIILPFFSCKSDKFIIDEGEGITINFLDGLNDDPRFELSKNTDNAKDTFKQYHKLLNEIENTTFTSEILKNKQLEIQTEAKKASAIFKEYSKLLDALDQRNNLIIAVLGNGFFLRDLHQVYKIEKWIKLY